MNGSASNLVGDITPGSIYAHIDQSLGPWEQRPIFKTNVRNFTTLRKVQPPISLSDLSMFAYPDTDKKLVVVDFVQNFTSPALSNKMQKRQYWIQENNTWKIIYEGAG